MVPFDRRRGLTRRTLLVQSAAGLAGGALASLATKAGGSTAADFQSLLDTAVASGAPGAALQIERGDETLFAGAAGYSNVERKVPATVLDRFRIYSITKTFVATLVLQLVDAGELRLDDPVVKWLTDPVVLAVPNIDRVTIRQLLTHSSGIYDFADERDSPFYSDAFLGSDADWARAWTPSELVAYAAGHPAYFAPGEGVHYSNTGYTLLGLIVEASTGTTLAEALQLRLVVPLGLRATRLELGKALPEDVVDGYQVVEGQIVNVSAINLTWAWAAGGMVSTVGDLAVFARALFAGDLKSPAAQTEMFTFGDLWGPLAFGMGLYRSDSPNGAILGMDGGSAGGTSKMVQLKGTDIIVVALVNISPDGGATNSLCDSALGLAVAG